MKRLLAASAIVGLAFAGAPAFAAGSGQTSGQAGKSSGQAASGQSMKVQAMSQDKLRSTLEKAGFQNIRIVDAAYLVQAQSPDGEQVMMFLNPPTTTAQAGQGTSSGGQSGQQQQASSQDGTSQATAQSQPTDRQQALMDEGSPFQASYRSFKQANLDGSKIVTGDMTAQEILSNQVVDPSDTQLGTVHDLLVDKSGKVQAALIDTGTGVGSGQYVAVQVNRLQVEQGSGGQLVLDTTEHALWNQASYKPQGQDWVRTSSP